MKRRNFYLSEEQIEFLKKLDDLTISEHIRRAIDQYIQELQPKNVSSSASTIIIKSGGEKDG